MDKKGMGIGQVFMFIIVAVTFGLIMIFGYKAVSTFFEKGEQVEFAQFRNQLQNDIKQIYTEYGSVREKTFLLPGKYREVCFVDLTFPPDDLTPPFDKPSFITEFCKESKDACSTWKDAYQVHEDRDELAAYGAVAENVFLDPRAPNPIKVFNIKIYAVGNVNGDEIREQQGFHCFPVKNSRLKLVLEGGGTHTKLLYDG